MLKINDTIKLVKEIGGFDKIGNEFVITNISESGTISFKAGYGMGTMSKTEFDEHFEKVKVKKEKKLGKWINSYEGYEYKTDYKRIVKVRKDGIKTKAICSPNDKFSLDDGIELCLARIVIEKFKG